MGENFHLILKIISYTGWTATTLLGFFGSWIWNFTKTDPSDPASRVLTPYGKWAIWVFIFAVVCSIASSILSEIVAAKAREKSSQEKKLLVGKLELLKGQNDDLNTRLTQVVNRHGIWDLAGADRVLHEKLTHLQNKIRGRAEERARISAMAEKSLPFDALGIFATFNLNAMSLKRNNYWTEELAGIISFMEADVVLLQEVPDQEVLRTFRSLLPQYDVRWLRLGSLRYRTGLALLYRRATVKLIDEPEVVGDQEKFGRLPVTQRIKINNLELQLVNLHLVWGKQGLNSPERLEELKLIIKEVHKKYKDRHVLLGGVFQWDEKRPEMQVLREAGYYLTADNLDENASESVMSDRVRRYSHFALSEGLAPKYIQNTARYEDLRLIYPGFDKDDWRGFVDHNPLLIALRVD